MKLPGKVCLLRFCHQCGKFEDVSLFDGKRRCGCARVCHTVHIVAALALGCCLSTHTRI